MKKINTLLFILCFLATQVVTAQRYLQEVFNDVEVTENVTFSANASIILIGDPMVGEAIQIPKNMDIYEPMGDTETDRPLVVLLHTGNFLPPTVNGGCGGTIKDQDMVNIATKLAKRGYVVSVADYRLGWNPVDPVQTNRVFGIINATYRGIQDALTAIRFMKLQKATYGIDENKVTLWGIGTGGYIATAAAALDTITDAWVPKFFAGPVPMVIEEVNGNVEGTTVGIVPPGAPAPFTPGDTLCYPQYVGTSSEFQLMVNMGGALGDSSWIDASDPAMINFHVPTDPFAPYDIGTVIVPPPANLSVVEVHGSYRVSMIADRLGLNDAWANETFIDDYTPGANANNGGASGLYPFVSSDPGESAPWNFATSAEPYGVMGSDCDIDAVSGELYLDTIMNYFAPRACLQLGLNCDLTGIIDGFVGTKSIDGAEVGLTVAPNPASDVVNLTTTTDAIQHVKVFDLSGRQMAAYTNVEDYNFNLPRGGLANGMYILQLQFEKGIVSKKLVFE